MDQINTGISLAEHMQRIARIGGKSKSPKKSAASRRNFAKAREARWKSGLKPFQKKPVPIVRAQEEDDYS